MINVDTLHHRVIQDGRPRGKRGSGAGEFHYPSRAVVLGNRAYVCDSWNHRVQVFELPDWRFAFEFRDFFCPKWIEVIQDRGRPLLVVVDSNNARLCFHESDGRRVGIFAFESQAFPVAIRVLNPQTIEVSFEDEHVEAFDIPGIIHPPDWLTRFDKPISIARDTRGFVYVSDFGRRTVEKFDCDGTFIAEVLGPGVLTLPGKMVMNGDDLLITDRPANAVFIYNTLDETYRQWDYVFDGPGFIARDSHGNIWVGTYVCEPNSNGTTFPVFTKRYEFLRSVAFCETHQPTSIAFAGGQILIADQDARNVFKFSEDGIFQERLRAQPYDSPVWSVMADGASHIYVGTSPVVDFLWAPDLNRLYYIDFEHSVVRYSGPCTLPSKQ